MDSVGDEASWPVPVPTGGSIQIQSGFYDGLEVVLDRDWLVIGRGRGAGVVLAEATIDRKSDVQGTRVALGGRRTIKKKRHLC